MKAEPTRFTWHTLYEYVESLIAGVVNIQQALKEHPELKLDDIYTSTFERELVTWRSCLLLISEIQKKEKLGSIRPIMGLNTIHLYYEDLNTAFAYITPLANGQYRFEREKGKKSKKLENLQIVEDMNLFQVVNEVEKLIKGIEADKNG